MKLSSIDRQIINHLQGGFPVCEDPWAQVSKQMGLDEYILIERIRQMQESGFISRFGPLYDAHKMGGGLTLAAMQVRPEDFEQVTEIVNSHQEIAHNYEREHRLNMWFVIATEFPEQVDEVIHQIEKQTGYPVYNMPKQEEYFLGLKLEV